MYFLELNPEDSLLERSLVSKRHRAGEITLDLINMEIVRQCVEDGIIVGKSVAVDATHSEANTIKKTPERLMKHLARNIMNILNRETRKHHVPKKCKKNTIRRIEHNRIL